LSADVEKLASMAGSSDEDRVELIATSTPSTSLSVDSIDMVYLCENADTVSSHYFAELAQVLKPLGCLMLSARYHRGNLPLEFSDDGEPNPGRALSDWTKTLIQAGLSQVETLDEQTLVLSFKPDGELDYSISEGLIRASKGERK